MTAQRDMARSPRPMTIDDLLAVAVVSEWSQGPPDLALSPDGTRVLYRCRRRRAGSNEYRTGLWVAALDDDGAARLLLEWAPTAHPDVTFSACWSPDSQRVACVVSEDSGIIRLLGLDGHQKWIDAGGPVLPGTLSWSPSGTELAFVRAGSPGPLPETVDRWRLATDGESTAGIEIDLDLGTQLTFQRPAPAQNLAVCRLPSGRIEVLGPPSLHVTDLSWAPDGRQLAVTGSVTHTAAAAEYRTDLFVLDRDDGTLRPLVAQPGAERNPVWSPDGRWIAFTSDRGRENHTTGGIPAVVPAGGGPPRYPTGALTEEFFGTGRMFFTADSAELCFECPYRLGRHLFRVPLDDGRPVPVTPPGDHSFTSFSPAPTTNRCAAVGQAPGRPQEVVVLDLAGDAPPRPVTRLNAHLEGLAPPEVRHLDWRSQDDRYDIHGLLLLPPGVLPGDPAPLLVEAVGGPAMAAADFGSVAFPVPALVAAGYAVLIPNTRSRAGFGEGFERAGQHSGSELRDAWLDLMAGVDHVVGLGYADPARMGVVGHSYGAMLTAYGVTQTHSFRTAVVHEGIVDLPGTAAFQWDTEDNKARLRELSGHGSPFDPVEYDAIRSESPIHLVHQVRTPVLVECGELSYAVKEAALLANGLRDHGVPVELVVYPRTGHVTTEPFLLGDRWRREIAWLDYWIRDLPLPDAAKQAAYDAWKPHQGGS